MTWQMQHSHPHLVPTLVPAATPPITTILFFLLVDMCIGIIDIQGNENLQRFSLKLSSFRIPSIAAYL